MNRFIAKTLLTLSLVIASFAAAQSPGTFQNVEHQTSDISSIVNGTWQTYVESGFTGDVKAMSRMSVTYLFHQDEQQLLVTFRQVDSGVTITTKNMSPVLLTSSR